MFGSTVKKDTKDLLKIKGIQKDRLIEPRHFMNYRQSEQYILNIAVG